MKNEQTINNFFSESECFSDFQVTRRVFLKSAAATLLGFYFYNCDGKSKKTIARFGIVTDLHYAGIEHRGNRFYKESAEKLKECINFMNTEKVDFLIELGDFKDQDDPPDEQRTIQYLKTIEAIFQQFQGPTYHVLGNHDVDSISKEQFLANVKNTNIPLNRNYYSFDSRNLHFVVLDANFKSDGTDYDHGNFNWTDTNIPPIELEWLQQELAVTKKPIIIFTHQLLDGEGDVFVRNAEQVRKILQGSGKVLAVFQGHHHEGSYQNIEEIHYYTLKAVVDGLGPENNSYAIVEVFSDHSIVITGYRRAVSKVLGKSHRYSVEINYTQRSRDGRYS